MRILPAFFLLFFLLSGLAKAGDEVQINGTNTDTDTHEIENIFDFLNLSSVDSGNSTSHYYDSEPILETYKPAINTTAYVTILDNSLSSQTQIFIPEKKLINPITLLFSGVVGIFLIGTYKILGVLL